MPDEIHVELRTIAREEIAINSQAASGTGSSDLPSRRLRRWAYAGFFAFCIAAWAALVWIAYIWLASP
jgi:hypothetical protein